jgi:hypothetical protein
MTELLPPFKKNKQNLENQTTKSGDDVAALLSTNLYLR